MIQATSTETVANQLLLLETHAYHSIEFHAGVKSLPTQEYTKSIVKDAIAACKPIVIVRSKKYWYEQVPQLVQYESTGLLIFTKNVRSAALSPRNLGDGFEKLVEQIRKG